LTATVILTTSSRMGAATPLPRRGGEGSHQQPFDIDTAFGQFLRRMPVRVRELQRTTLAAVSEDGLYTVKKDWSSSGTGGTEPITAQ
jgi:hypothetical protein